MKSEDELPHPVEGAEPSEPDPAGVGPGGGTPYTVYFPAEDGYRAADLAHAAPLPQVGDSVEYLDESGVTHRYRVREVVHTLQVAPAYRPRARFAAASSEGSAEGAEGAEGAADAGDAIDEPRGVPEASELRAGLPEVILEALPDGG
jgi:hypothetical protein